MLSPHICGIYESVALRSFSFNEVVVEYYDGDAVLFENLDGFDVLRAAVDDDDEVAFALRNDLRDVLVQPVALIEAVRDEVAHVRALRERELHRYRGRRYAVHVVIAVDDDVRRRPEAAHQSRGVRVVGAQVELFEKPRQIGRKPVLHLFRHNVGRQAAHLKQRRLKGRAVEPCRYLRRYFRLRVYVERILGAANYQ